MRSPSKSGLSHPKVRFCLLLGAAPSAPLRPEQSHAELELDLTQTSGQTFPGPSPYQSGRLSAASVRPPLLTEPTPCDPPANASLPASRGSDPQGQADAVWSPRLSRQHSAQQSPAGPGLSWFSAKTWSSLQRRGGCSLQSGLGKTNSDNTFWRQPNVQTIKFDQNRFGLAYDENLSFRSGRFVLGIERAPLISWESVGQNEAKSWWEKVG